MMKIDYSKLRQLETEPLLEFEEQIAEKIQRELEAKKRGDEKDKKKKKKKKGREQSDD